MSEERKYVEASDLDKADYPDFPRRDLPEETRFRDLRAAKVDPSKVFANSSSPRDIAFRENYREWLKANPFK
jgi:hypothetical protein